MLWVLTVNYLLPASTSGRTVRGVLLISPTVCRHKILLPLYTSHRDSPSADLEICVKTVVQLLKEVMSLLLRVFSGRVQASLICRATVG